MTTSKLRCPKCGNDDPTKFEYCEMVPRYAPVRAGSDGRVIVDISDDNVFWDGAGEEVFYCRAGECCAEIPAGDLVEDFV